MKRTNPFSQQVITAGLIAVLTSSAVTLAAVTFDGQLDFTATGEWAAPSASAVQDNYTGFGNQVFGGFTGSELDELYVRTDGEFLYVAVTGNLEQNGNAQIILIDVRPGGLNELNTSVTPELDANGVVVPCAGLGPPFAVPNLGPALITDDQGTPADPGDDLTIRDPLSSSTKLDAGFEPDYAIAYDTTGGVLYITQYNFSATALGQWDDPVTNNGSTPCSNRFDNLDYFATRVYRGSNLVGNTLGTADGGINPNGSLFGYDNSGYQGVTGTAVAAPASGNPGDPRTQTSGFESKISLLDLGFAPEDLPLVGNLSVKVQVILTSGGGYVSNQSLPGIGGGTSTTNLEFRPDYTTYLNNQYASAVLTPAAFAPTIDGVNILAEWGAASIIASQDTVTGFGDKPQFPNVIASQGNEINQIFVQDGPSGEGLLHIGIPGNLSGDGTNLVIFFDTVAGGEATLADNVGRLAGNNGDTLPLQADYALLMNIYAGTHYTDLHDLALNTETYIGATSINSGSGTMNNGGPVPNWQMAFNNDNVLGVNGNSADDPVVQSLNARTATTGWEMAVPLSAIGNPAPGTDICVFAIITGNGGNRWLSNQILPAGLGGAKDNWGDGGGSRTNLATEGYSCLTVTLGAGSGCNNPRFDADNDGDVDQTDFGFFQACYTGAGPGDPQNPLYNPDLCACFDWNTSAADGDVDQEDLGIFEICAKGSIPLGVSASGPGIPADDTCDDPQ